jgi:pimeloyl-ACP methyl ester carboxylesterase
MATFSLHQPVPTVVAGARPGRRSDDSHISTSLSLAGEALAGFDWLALRMSNVYAGAGVPRGDGSAIVLVPGMLASNASLLELRAWLRRIGYRPYVAEMRRNDCCPEDTLDCVLEAVDRAYEETGRRVCVIGHSLGGLIARGAAMARPERVSRVITLGTPVNGVRVHPAVAIGGALFMRAACDGSCVEALQSALPAGVRETSIYTKSDGIVEWTTCISAFGASIEVRSSHIGMIASADAYRAIARTLAEPALAVAPTKVRRAAAVVQTTMPTWIRRRAA